MESWALPEITIFMLKDQSETKPRNIKQKSHSVKKLKNRLEFQQLMNEFFVLMESWSSAIFLSGFLPQT